MASTLGGMVRPSALAAGPNCAILLATMGFFQLEKGPEVEGRIAMRMAASALLLAQSIILALSIIPLRADPSQHGSKDEAVAMVKRVEDIFNKEGAAATFKAVSDPSTKAFHDRDLYPLIFADQRRAGAVRDAHTRQVVNERIQVAIVERLGGGVRHRFEGGGRALFVEYVFDALHHSDRLILRTMLGWVGAQGNDRQR